MNDYLIDDKKSVANSLDELQSLEEDEEFELSSQMYSNLEKYYSNGFGFVICKFESTRKTFPLGIINQTLRFIRFSIFTFNAPIW
jgi:hypothetical protein